MNFRVLTVPACFLLLGACTTYPAQTVSNNEVDVAVAEEAVSADVAAAARASGVDEDRIICKRYQVTGSKFKKKRCMSWAAWKEQEDRAKVWMRDRQTRAGTGPNENFNLPPLGSRNKN
ncbi:MAG: hypothetical protein GXP04_04935 [Alphaproteobacteria bacterium]|nr:hypothetical protein [Alphaproteobacteria bacterium]